MELFINENLLFNKNPTINTIQIAIACDISLDILPNSTKLHIIERFVKSIAVMTIKKL